MANAKDYTVKYNETLEAARAALSLAETLLAEDVVDTMAKGYADGGDFSNMMHLKFQCESLVAMMHGTEWEELYGEHGLLAGETSDDRPLAQGDGWVVADVG